MSHELAVLHAVRVRGAATTEHVAARADLPVEQAHEVLLDLEAFGWVSRYSHFGESGWTITEGGKAHGEVLLAEQARSQQAVPVVRTVYDSFLELNDQFLTAITAWQLEGHADSTVDDLRRIVASVYPLLDILAERLDRFAGYRPRLSMAMSMALVGRDEWVDGLTIDSLHRVWFELHEDLLATLGLQR